MIVCVCGGGVAPFLVCCACGCSRHQHTTSMLWKPRVPVLTCRVACEGLLCRPRLRCQHCRARLVWCSRGHLFLLLRVGWCALRVQCAYCAHVVCVCVVCSGASVASAVTRQRLLSYGHCCGWCASRHAVWHQGTKAQPTCAPHATGFAPLCVMVWHDIMRHAL